MLFIILVFVNCNFCLVYFLCWGFFCLFNVFFSFWRKFFFIGGRLEIFYIIRFRDLGLVCFIWFFFWVSMFFVIGSFFGMFIRRFNRIGYYDCFGECGVINISKYGFFCIFCNIWGINIGGGNVYVNIFF